MRTLHHYLDVLTLTWIGLLITWFINTLTR